MQRAALHEQCLLCAIDDVVYHYQQFQVYPIIARVLIGIGKPHDKLLRQFLHPGIEHVKLRHGQRYPTISIELLAVDLLA